MDKREEVLKEVLIKNEEERKRWELYKKENEAAIENLTLFGKKLSVDIMVPIGSRGLLPGQICHTNEVFISHFSGMFSKCSAFQAQTICNHRIKLANDQLEKLKAEHQLFQNKLELPRNDVIPNEGQQELIEEYDEESEKLWRERHKRSLREHKQKEREHMATEEVDKNYNEVWKILEELELMEELDQELDQLQVEDDETLQKLISGEMKLPNDKKRVSYYNCSKINGEIGNVADINTETRKEKSAIEEISAKYQTLDMPNTQLKDFTNNNTIPNSNDFNLSDTDSNDSLNSDIPEEIIQAEKETANLSKKQQLRIYKNKLKQIEKSLKNLKIQNLEDLGNKANLLEIREHFMDFIEILKDEVEGGETSEEEQVIKKHEASVRHVKYKKKKSISFALEDQIKFIDSDSEVISMFRDENEKQRDIISLDTSSNRNISQDLTTYNTTPTIDKKTAILEKVERNYNFIAENQSHQDFDLVEKILNGDENEGSPLYIKFNHSNNIFQYPGYEVDNISMDKSEVIIGSPADVYRLFSTHREDSDTNIKQVNNRSKINDDVNAYAYEDPRIKIFSSNKDEENKENLGQQTSIQETTKSILKNKDAVKEEKHFTNLVEKKVKRKTKSVDNQYCTAFDMVVGDIVENQITQPDPLPKEKFVDAHAPKKRISRFKQMRSTPT